MAEAACVMQAVRRAESAAAYAATITPMTRLRFAIAVFATRCAASHAATLAAMAYATCLRCHAAIIDFRRHFDAILFR